MPNWRDEELGLNKEQTWYKVRDIGGYRLYRVRAVLARRQTPYQKVEILDVEGLGRCLFLDGEIQSAEADEFIYHELLVHPAVRVHPHPRRVLVCGTGEGKTIREILRYPQVEKVVAVDIDREVVALCQEYLAREPLDDPRCELVFADIAEYVSQYQGPPFDVVVVDVTDDAEGPAGTVYVLEFYRRLERIVASPGVVAVQGTSAYSGIRSIGFGKLYHILVRTFPCVFPYAEYIPSFEDLWGFFLCLKGMEELHPCLPLPPGLRYYDEEAHRRAFSLAKPLREQLKRGEALLP